MITNRLTRRLKSAIKGEFLIDNLSRHLYSTDASVYCELPIGVALPRDAKDVSAIVRFARANNLPLIPRGAGTSLAGQVVGSGVVVDMSRHMNRVIEINPLEGWAEVEPGVILDDLNREAAKHGLFFGPETSTSNRCTIGGMVGNNSCGARSLVHGSTRDHVISVSGFLSSGKEITFNPLTKLEFEDKCSLQGDEGDIFRLMREIYTGRVAREQIRAEFPHPEIKRRNCGYALDALLDTCPFIDGGELFNLSRLVTGSEGTLMLVTSIKVALVPLPSPHVVLLCSHFNSLDSALDANLLIIQSQKPDAVELIDHNILELATRNPAQRENRFFVQGNPSAMLLIEFSGNTIIEARDKAARTITALQGMDPGHHFTVVEGNDISKVWSLRKAGLGLLSNLTGDARPVSLIEDSAVRVEDLKAYVADINTILAKHGKSCVYHAHVGSGELHIRPVLDLTNASDVAAFRTIGEETARVVKSYRGSLSGEHGDGRVRGEFIPLMVGEYNYNLMKRVKMAFDPAGILNPGKKVFAPPMDESFRYRKASTTSKKDLAYNWGNDNSPHFAAGRCNGSADCLKGHKDSGTMCPSYMGTREEKDSTRGRANILRSYLQGNNEHGHLTLDDLASVLDLCLSCKACKSECPSGVDMAKLKAELMQQVHDHSGISPREMVLANIATINRLLHPLCSFLNPIIKSSFLKPFVSKLAGFSAKRSLPLYSATSLERWVKNHHPLKPNEGVIVGTLMLFADEITNYHESELGIKSILLLNRLGYKVAIAPVKESGRIKISRGFLRSAKKLANKNLVHLAGKISADMPLVGIEPSTVLTFKDEYLDLAPGHLKDRAREIALHTYTFEEFINREIDAGRIKRSSFTKSRREIKFHAHCHEKAMSRKELIKKVLSFPENYSAVEIDSGCCGMAGTFGYEKRNYELSMRIGNLKLFPAVRDTPASTTLVATGYSCRCQIKDGTGRDACHPVDVLFEALI